MGCDNGLQCVCFSTVPSNAALEWQASMGWHSRGLVVVCPLKGLVRRLENQFLAMNLQESLD